MNSTTDMKRWVPVPYDCFPTTKGGLYGVYLSPNEDVEWLFKYYTWGRRVVGYTIIKTECRPDELRGVDRSGTLERSKETQ